MARHTCLAHEPLIVLQQQLEIYFRFAHCHSGNRHPICESFWGAEISQTTGPPDRTTTYSVTRFGDLLHFGQIFKACGINYFALHFYTIFVKASKTFIFLVKSFLGNFYRHLATFFWSHWTTTTTVIRRLRRCSLDVLDPSAMISLCCGNVLF